MDVLKRQRKLLRTVFSKQITNLNGIIEENIEKINEIKVSFKILEDKYNQLRELDNQVQELMLKGEETTENDFLSECSKVDEYVSTFEYAKLKVDSIVKNSDESSFISQPVSDVNSKSKQFKLPKIELTKFDGQLINWLPFWSQFSKIDNDRDIAAEDKFQYLIQCVVPGTRAYEVVQSFPPIEQNYSKVIESLKSRFGKDDLLVEVYVRELLKIVLQNSISNKSQISLQTLYDKLESHLRNLETLGVTSDKCACILYPMVESCMPEELLRAWQRSSYRTGDLPQDRLKNIMKFMLSEVDSEQRISLALSGFGVNSSSKEKSVKKYFSQQGQKEQPATAASLVSASKYDKQLTCIFCSKPHKSSDCFSAQKMSLNEKTQIVKDKKCCFCCLQSGHSIKYCKNNIKCPLCKKRHFVVMCPNFHVNKSVSKTSVDVSKSETKENCNESVDNVLANNPISSRPNSLTRPNPKVFMQTLVAKLRNPSNNTVLPVRLLFDTGSERSYMIKDLANKMEYESIGQENIVHALFGNVKTGVNIHNKYRVYLTSKDNSYKCNFEVLSQHMICGDITHVTPGPWIEELKSKGIYLTDSVESSLPVSILVGADVAGKLFTGERVQLDSGLVAMQTLLGWTLMGKLPKEREDRCLASVVTNMFIRDADISDLWSLDLIGIKEPPETTSKKDNELSVKKHFLDTTTVNEEGRYEIRLPWVESHPPLPTNQSLAEKRLTSVSKKLQSNGLFKDYSCIFQDWLQQGIIEVVSSDEPGTNCHYLPHRPVVKENSLTTRVRPVFDASARDKLTPSLNDCLECGPNLIELIPTVMLRFREGKFGVIADIAKAFLQISVNQEDRDYLRFCWYADDCKDVIVYRHKRVVFGVKCSPFLLGATIELHLQRSAESHRFNPFIVQKLQKSFYVDNVSASVDTLQDLEHFIEVSQQIMADGKFDLRGWKTTECTEKPCVPESSCTGPTNVLGVKWDFQNDLLFVNLDCIKDFDCAKITKRQILSISHKVFDPIGFVCPVLLYPKLLLQDMWDQKVDWDTEVDSNTAENFMKWFNELSALQEIQIPRWIGKSTDSKGCSIHTFCDGSKKAYGSVIFLRVEKQDKVEVQLLAAKSRVAPLKKMTIPRLELLATTVGARLTETVVKGMNWTDIPIYYWTDSTTVLGWLKQECNWKVFVWNRVSEIRRLTKVENWNHIQGEFNPADLPSRGCTAKYLLKSKWWEGPNWLKSAQEEWPINTEITFISEEIEQEKRKSTEIKSMINKNYNENWYSNYFSQYRKIVRLVAWVSRFIYNCRTKEDVKLSGELGTFEIEMAERKLLTLIQQESFDGIKDKSISCLNPFTDEFGLIRLKTKLSKKEDIDYGVRFPILLPAQHSTVKALIMESHIKNCHAGVQILLNILRDSHWILGGRRTIRNVISKCVVCKRHKSKNLEATTGTLPIDRMRDCAVFEVTGTDFAGPLYLKKNEKAWICIFTCAVYRAVHFELVTSLSSDAFLQAFRRFIARRGRPRTMYSDNGTNYVGVKNSIDQLDWKEIKEYSSIQHIHWKLNPPASPWWGGWWERIVRMLKELLRRVLRRASLSYQEMTTVLCDCESVINSRPLTYVYDGVEELSPLTPKHFLQDIKESGVPDLDKLNEVSLNRRNQYLQTLKKELRERFKREYLGQLIERSNVKSKNDGLKIGDIVLVECNNLKRVDWPLAIVEEVMPDKEGVIRVVKIRTSKGTLIRPTKKLYQMEISKGELDDMNLKKDPAKKKGETQNEKLKHTSIQTRCGRTIKTPSRYEF